jgi:hypothetical protein
MRSLNNHDQKLKHKAKLCLSSNLEVEIIEVDAQIEYIKQRCIENPQIHPTALHKELLAKCQGKTTSILTAQQIQGILARIRKNLFIPSESLDSCKLVRTESGHQFCQKVHLFPYFI